MCNLRYFNAAGAAHEDGIGEDHCPETHLIPLAMDVALGRRKNIDIFGTDYDTPDGTCIRDFVHVKDLAAGHVLALKYLSEEKGCHIFNLGSGEGKSVSDVIKVVENIAQSRIEKVIERRRQGDPAILIADWQRAHNILGWRPEHNFDEIINDAWLWHQERFGRQSS